MNAPAPRVVTESTAIAVYSKATEDANRMIAQAIDKAVPIETMERLLAMRDKLRAEAAKGAYLDAMSRFQARCPVVKKNRKAKIQSKGGGQFEYTYAEIGHIVKVVGPLIAAEGLSYRIEVKLEKDPPSQVAKCIVSHILGHSEESEFRAPVDANAVVNDMQKAASAQTFAKRIAFCNAFGILTSDQDDDGRTGGAGGKTDDKGKDEPQDYPADRFLKNLPSWKKMIEGGQKTADQIIATVGSKYRFSEDQLTKIRAATQDS